MKIESNTQTLAQVTADWLIVGVAENTAFEPRAAALDQALGGTLSRLKEMGDLTGKAGELLELRGLTGIEASRLLIVGWGDLAKLTLARFDQTAMAAVRKLSSKRDLKVAFNLPEQLGTLTATQAAQSIATAFKVGCAGQGIYKSEPDRFEFALATIALPTQVTPTTSKKGEQTVAQAIERGAILGDSINLTRELVNRHPGELYPESFAKRAEHVAEQLGLHCEIFDEHRLRQERMLSLLGVAQGSSRPARMVVIEYHGGPQDGPTLALVGKGVTFDSGGLSLKPTEGMKTMKCDMAGAATVLGAIAAIARLKLPVHVVGLMGLVENMVSGDAYKLGEVLTARNGTTIEVLNTDAEGRLVLADVLSYTLDRGCSCIIDLATLTGACVVALGEEVSGAFTNHQSWCDQVLSAAKRVGEDTWQLPMFDSYSEQLKCDVADIKNVGNRWGGAITAAKFLEKFVGSTPWVHLDIAGPAFSENSKPHRDAGGTGVMLKTLVEVAVSQLPT